MFVIELLYKADLTEIDAHMRAHMAFVNKQYAAGRFVLPGRKIPRDGGIIIAVAESGPNKLEEIKDPFGSGPFEYRPLEKGFELKSKLLFEGQPVTLTVGQRKKE